MVGTSKTPFILKIPGRDYILTLTEFSQAYALADKSARSVANTLFVYSNHNLDFSDIFYLDGEHLSFTNERKHPIDTKDAKAIYTKSYRYPQIHKEEVRTQVSKMLERGIIRPSSPWFSSCMGRSEKAGLLRQKK